MKIGPRNPKLGNAGFEMGLVATHSLIDFKATSSWIFQRWKNESERGKKYNWVTDSYEIEGRESVLKNKLLSRSCDPLELRCTDILLLLILVNKKGNGKTKNPFEFLLINWPLWGLNLIKFCCFWCSSTSIFNFFQLGSYWNTKKIFMNWISDFPFLFSFFPF